MNSPAPRMNEFCFDLTKLAEEGGIDPVFGRAEEIRRVASILCRRNKRNLLLVGEPGVGKSAIIAALAFRIVLNQVPDELSKTKIISLNLAEIHFNSVGGDLIEDRIQDLLREISGAGRAIFFIDDVHSDVDFARLKVAIDQLGIISRKPNHGELRVVVVTTTDGYRKHAAFLGSSFQELIIPEPPASEMLSILRGIKPKYEAYHGVVIQDRALIAAAALCGKVASNRAALDKAIDIVDEAAACLKLEIGYFPRRIFPQIP